MLDKAETSPPDPSPLDEDSLLNWRPWRGVGEGRLVEPKFCGCDEATSEGPSTKSVPKDAGLAEGSGFEVLTWEEDTRGEGEAIASEG